MTFRRILLAVGWVIAVQASVLAHPAPFSYVDIETTRDGLNVSIVMHAFDVAHDLQLTSEERVFDADFVQTRGQQLTRLVLSRFSILADGRTLNAIPVDVSSVPDRRAARVRLRYAATNPGLIDISCSLFPYDAMHQTFVNIYDEGRLRRQFVLDARQTRAAYYSGSTQSTGDVVRKFVVAGIEHIAIGPDHILFLVGLLLLGGSVIQLLKIVTAFTIAHSITLTIAALNILSPSARLVEPAIALSIIYVGIDNLLVKPGARDTRVWIALTFGLIHGFGFASVLREMDLPRRALGWSLFSFNLGVEIGQVCIVLLVASLLAWIAARSAPLRTRVVYAGSVIVAAAGVVWFVQRVFFVGGGA